jgi:hypothetical protein
MYTLQELRPLIDYEGHTGELQIRDGLWYLLANINGQYRLTRVIESRIWDKLIVTPQTFDNWKQLELYCTNHRELKQEGWLLA